MLLRPVFAALLALAGTFTILPGAAQVQRNFPENALRGALVIGQPPEILLNGKPARLAPGARIRNQANMLQMSGQLIGTRLLVHYTLDSLELVKDVWILTPEEAAKKPWPTTPQQAQEWRFDPIAQTWSRP
jgi:hypothetical protein